MKKIIVLITIFLLCACQKSPVVEKTNEYIKPLNEVALFDKINDSLKEELISLNNDKKIDEYIIKDIGKELEELVLKDINGNLVDLKDYKEGKFILEIVAYWCPHCKIQTKETEEFLKDNPDVKFIQFFKDGDKELINEFYNEAEIEVPDFVIIPEDNAFTKYLTQEFEPQYIPSFFFFNDGKLTYIKISELTNNEFKRLNKYVFGDECLSKEKLVDNEGESIFKDVYSYIDVLNELSFKSKDKLALIEGSENLTINIIGKSVEFNNLYDTEGNPTLQLDDYSSFYNKETVIFYVGNVEGSIEKEINLINEFIDKHPKTKVLTILIDSKDISTSDLYLSGPNKLKGEVISSNSMVPKTLLDTAIIEYPAMLFIQDNIFTGGFYNLSNIEKMEYAYKTFLGEESIALLKNN